MATSPETAAIAEKFRDDANAMEQEAARLRAEAELLRNSAWDLVPRGRPPATHPRAKRIAARHRGLRAAQKRAENGVAK